jgi:CPA1 family monovalent cation:H+ antiporter
VPGVVITAAVVAVVVSVSTGLDLALGFLLGAIVSATDPVAVVELFRRLDAPCRLTTVVDAEALFNDGTGVVLFTIALHAVSGPVGLADGAAQFVAIVVVSGIIGLVAGAAAVRLMALTTDRLVQATISVVAAYGTYLVALRLGESGIIATVMAGVVIGWAGDRGMLPRRTMAALDAVWSFAAYMITALTFLLIGMTIGPELVLRAAPLIAAGFLAITIARVLVVYGLIGGTERALPGPSILPVGHLHVMFWAGLRGAIATALVLALPTDLPQRDLLTGAVYGIVLLTLVVQGTTAGWVIRRSALGTAA